MAKRAALAAFLSSDPAVPKPPPIAPVPNRSALDLSFFACSEESRGEEEDEVPVPNRSALRLRASLLSDFEVLDDGAAAGMPNRSARVCFFLSSSVVFPEMLPPANLLARASFRSFSDTFWI